MNTRTHTHTRTHARTHTHTHLTVCPTLHHSQHPKSTVAAKAAKDMNPLFNVEAHENRVGGETESILNVHIHSIPRLLSVLSLPCLCLYARTYICMLGCLLFWRESQVYLQLDLPEPNHLQTGCVLSPTPYTCCTYA